MKTEYTGKDNLEAMKEAKNYNEYLSRLVSKSARPNDLIVDFGAGCGTFAIPLYKNGFNVKCIETDTELSSALNKSGLYVSSDISKLEDDSISYIYSLNVLEHIADDQSILNDLFKKIKPNGTILIYVPAFQFLFSDMDRKVCHFRRYSKRDLVKKMQSAGFLVVSAKYADSLGFFATLAYKIISRENGDININMLKMYDRWVFPLSEALDRIFANFFGKNVWVHAQKP